MQHAFYLYRRLLGVQFRSQLQYRSSFILDFISTGLLNGVSFVSLALVLQRFGSVGGWTVGEIAFLYGMVESAFGAMDMIFSGFDPPVFGRYIRQGLFDQLMLRPVDLTLQVLGSQFMLRRTGRILQGAIVFGVALRLVSIHWTLAKLLYLPLVFASLVAFFGGFFIIGAAITFWTVESIEVVNIFTYGGTELMSYPMNIFPDWLRDFFTYIVPAIFLNYYPALYILDKSDPLGLPYIVRFLAPLAGFGVLAAALLFWNFGIQHYQSTGT